MKRFRLNGKVFSDVAVESVGGGDSCVLTLTHADDAVFKDGARTTWLCRLSGIHAPDHNTPATAPEAQRARERLAELLGDGRGWRVFCGEMDKRGRVLVVIRSRRDGSSINELLVREGHAQPLRG